MSGGNGDRVGGAVGDVVLDDADATSDPARLAPSSAAPGRGVHIDQGYVPRPIGDSV